MRAAILTVAFMSLGVFAQNIADFPVCSLTCLTGTPSSDGCMLEDSACLCMDTAYQAAVAACVEISCPEASDQQQATTVGDELCAGVEMDPAAGSLVSESAMASSTEVLSSASANPSSAVSSAIEDMSAMMSGSGSASLATSTSTMTVTSSSSMRSSSMSSTAARPSSLLSEDSGASSNAVNALINLAAAGAVFLAL